MWYGIISNPSSSGNSTSNVILERIQQVLGNLMWTFNVKETYVDKDDPWSGILLEADFEVRSTLNG